MGERVKDDGIDTAANECKNVKQKSHNDCIEYQLSQCQNSDIFPEDLSFFIQRSSTMRTMHGNAMNEIDRSEAEQCNDVEAGDSKPTE